MNLIKENNKLIADFMSVELTGIGKYHESWDWLMPVIEDIDHIKFEPVESIEKALFTRSIRDTHKAVVEYIEEYILIQQESSY